MKKILFTLTSMLFTALLFSQAPEQVNYQAVARNSAGEPLVNTTVNLTFEILQGSGTGGVVFSESQTKSTNDFGLFTARIGSVNTTDFPSIVWGSNTYFLRITVNGDVMQATQLLSVPYALHANTAASGVPGADGIDGLDGINGIDGTNGLNGVDGAIGAAGSVGTNGVDGINGIDGIGIDSVQHNADGTLTIFYSNATTFITGDLTGPAGANGTTFIAGNGISIVGDTISAIDVSATNELQVLSINGTNDTISLSNGGGSVALLTGTVGWGTDTVVSSGANISGRGIIGSPLIVTDNDNDPTNELELPLTGNTNGDVIKWNGSVWLALKDSIDDADADATNELQNLSWNNADSNTITISGGSGVSLSSNAPDTNQVLTWNGANWFAQNPGSGADNWGSQVVTIDSTLNGQGTISQPLSGFDGQYSSLTGAPTNHLTSIITDGFSLSGDGTTLNPLSAVSQNLWITGNSLFISLGGASTSISSNSPSLNEVLTWNGSSWTSQAPSIDADADGWPATMDLDDSNNLITFFDGDASDSNELITNFGVNGTSDSLLITEAGNSHAVALSDLASGNAWTKGTGNIIFNNTDSIGIGTTTPSVKLEVTEDILVNGLTIGKGGGSVSNNTAIGFGALSSNLGAVENTAIGVGALTSNLTGYANTAIGAYALYVSDGLYNTATGKNALRYLTAGSNNTANGNEALLNTLGSGNTGIGFRAGKINVSGANNTFLGYNADATVSALTNATAIGANAQVGVSNALVLGNNANVGIGTNSPGYPLHVKKDFASNYVATIENAGFEGGGLKVMTLFDANSYALNLEIDGNQFFKVRNDLMVGIGLGSALPTNTLHLDGSLRLENIGGTNTNGNVLTTDGTGVATWKNVAGDGNGLYSGSDTLSGATTVFQNADRLTFNSTANEGFHIDNHVATNHALAVENITDGAPGYASGAVGVRVAVSAANATKTGVHGTVTGTGTGNQTGVWGNAEGAGSGFNRGINAVARNSSNTNIAGDFTTSGNIGNSYGLRVSVSGTQTNNKYGLRLTSAGNGSKYGVFSQGEDYNYFSGNVGIGVFAATAKLEVAGTVKITDGTEGLGKILTSDANGNATWASNSIYNESGNLNSSSFNATTTWQAIGTGFSVMKTYADSKVEVTFNSYVNGGTFGIGCNGVLFEVRIDGVTANFDNQGAIKTTGTEEFISMFAVFEGLTVGAHVIQVYTRTFVATSAGIVFDPTGWGGRMISKETF
tara:strand:+ start:627 stop:4328 length:3702 start_codon:yes stop_codon:yes gene_type:complete